MELLVADQRHVLIEPISGGGGRVTAGGQWGVQIRISKQNSSDLFAGKWLRAPATIND